jgi:hypothetical protein
VRVRASRSGRTAFLPALWDWTSMPALSTVEGEPPPACGRPQFGASAPHPSAPTRPCGGARTGLASCLLNMVAATLGCHSGWPTSSSPFDGERSASPRFVMYEGMRVPASSVLLPASGFQLPASSFRLPASSWQLVATIRCAPPAVRRAQVRNWLPTSVLRRFVATRSAIGEWAVRRDHGFTATNRITRVSVGPKSATAFAAS